MNDQLKLSNGQVVDAVFLGLDSEGTGQYGNWFKYSLKVDGKEMIYFANDNQKPIFESLKRDESFKFGKMKKEASIVAGVAVKVAGWSIAPGSFTEQELLNRSKVVLSVLNKLETDLLTQQIEEIFE